MASRVQFACGTCTKQELSLPLLAAAISPQLLHPSCSVNCSGYLLQPDGCLWHVQKFVLHELVSLLARSISQQAGTRRSIDQRTGAVGPRVVYSSDSLMGLANAVAAVDALRAIEGMDSSDAVAQHLVSLGAVQHLMRLVSAGEQAGSISNAVSSAARLLQQLTAGQSPCCGVHLLIMACA